MAERSAPLREEISMMYRITLIVQDDIEDGLPLDAEIEVGSLVAVCSASGHAITGQILSVDIQADRTE